MPTTTRSAREFHDYTGIPCTPWGAAEQVTWQRNPAGAPTVAFVSTPSHGGFYVPADVRHRMPAHWAAATFRQRGLTGWFEEDCDAYLVVLAFRECFSRAQIEDAWHAAHFWFELGGKLPAGSFGSI